MNPSMDAARVDARDLPLELIGVQAGFNSRWYFDESGLKGLAHSIKEQGVVQPIAVRPDPEQSGRFLIIAGERRWRASKIAGKQTIPAVIRDVDEHQARLMRATENAQREDISPGEEADEAREIVSLCNGDRDEAARLLGWSRSVLDARLALLNATREVREALAQRKIKLGHAELLVTLPSATQNGTLARLLEADVSVDDLRTKIASFALDLQAAIFDTSGCRGCPRNSSTQSSLFDVHVGEGRCGDHECYEQKRQERLGQMLTERATEYPRIVRDTDQAPSSYTVLLATGEGAVGREQLTACMQCAHYGAVMRTRAGEEGQVQTDVCFNLPCHAEKVKEYADSLGTDTSDDDDAEAASDTNKASSRMKKAPHKTKAKKKTSVAATPRKVEELVQATWRKAAGAEVLANPKMGLVYGVYALLRDLGDKRSSVCKTHNLAGNLFESGKREKAIAALWEIDAEALKKVMVDAAAAVAHERTDDCGRYGSKDAPEMVRTAKATLTAIGSDLRSYFTLDKEFLEAHTKSGIASLMAECGFDKWWNTKEKDEKAFAKLMNDKHGDIVKRILKSGFDFKGFVPKAAALGK